MNREDVERVREVVYFLGVDIDDDDFVAICETCGDVRPDFPGTDDDHSHRFAPNVFIRCDYERSLLKSVRAVQSGVIWLRN
ncbi:hypothetical protein ACFQEV_02045 [Halopelagius fulvigenes]|uniref:Uncharacterized protein n=1 Tax=Halopelagius fulvigenes TaxID=1198324 RepID=A0ABD5TWE3_9EURY